MVSLQEIMSHKGGPAVVEVTTAVVMMAFIKGGRGVRLPPTERPDVENRYPRASKTCTEICKLYHPSCN
jgi:hypothetical protein